MSTSFTAGTAVKAMPGSSKATTHLRDLLAFGRWPDRRPGRRDFMSRWCVVVVLDLLLLPAFSALTFILLEHIQNLPSVFDQMPAGLLGLSGLLFAPLVEEMVFRAGLRNASYLMFVGPGLMALMVGAWWVVLAWPVLAALLLVLWHRRLDRPGKWVRQARRFSARYGTWFWLYTLAFGLVHVGNYQPGTSQWPWLPLLVLPQITTGFFLGYLRVRNGLYSAMAAHFAHNLVAIGLLTWLR